MSVSSRWRTCDVTQFIGMEGGQTVDPRLNGPEEDFFILRKYLYAVHSRQPCLTSQEYGR